MKKLTLLAALLACGMAHAFSGTPRHEWIGRSVADSGLPHAGKPTVYVFTQPDCAPCSLQLGALSALQRSNPGLQVTVVTEQNSATLREYLGAVSPWTRWSFPTPLATASAPWRCEPFPPPCS